MCITPDLKKPKKYNRYKAAANFKYFFDLDLIKDSTNYLGRPYRLNNTNVYKATDDTAFSSAYLEQKIEISASKFFKYEVGDEGILIIKKATFVGAPKLEGYELITEKIYY